MNILVYITILASLIASTVAINCYICNSSNKPECENDYKSFLKVCPVKSFGGMKGVKAKGCRIIRQYIKDDYSIVRECAYSGEDVDNKSNKGSLGVQRIVSQCSESACNSSPFTITTTTFIVTLIAIFKIFS